MNRPQPDRQRPRDYHPSPPPPARTTPRGAAPLRGAAALALLLLCAAPAAAQVDPLQGDPQKEIAEIARRVDEQLREIDRLLLESSKRQQGGTESPKQMLTRSKQQSEAVEQGIDELIQKLNEMKKQSGSPSPDQQDQPKPDGQPQPGGQQPQGQPNRREGSTPDFMQQPQNRPGGQQPQPQGNQEQQGQKPQGGEQNPDGGQNQPATAPPDQATGPAQPGTGEGEWGNLQPYLNYLKNHGTVPKVPDKFRKYYEAFLKQGQQGGAKKKPEK